MYTQFFYLLRIGQVHPCVEFFVFCVVYFDVLLINRCVRQICILVIQLIRIVVVTRETQVIVSVEPDLELGLPAGDAYPLTNVKLLLLDNERRLDVLLRDPDAVHA